MRSTSSNPVRLLAAFCGVVLAAITALISIAASEASPRPVAYSGYYIARADTDSVAVRLDSLLLDSLQVTSGDSLGFLDSLGLGLDSLGLGLDSLAVDSLRADSLAQRDTLEISNFTYVPRYIPRVQRDGFMANIRPRKDQPFSANMGTYWRHQIELDSLSNEFRITEKVWGSRCSFSANRRL